MAVAYEWAVELVDEYDDVIDTVHRDTLREALEDRADYLEDPSPDIHHVDIALTRLWSRDFEREGLEDREYAYLDERGRLPEFFEATGGGVGAKVPERFRKEAQREARGN